MKNIIFKQQTLFALLIILASIIGLITAFYQKEPNLSPGTNIITAQKGIIILVLLVILTICTMFLISILLKTMNNTK